MLKYFLVGAIAGLLVLMAYVRLAPLNPAARHDIDLPVGPAGEVTTAGGHTVIMDVADATAALAKLDRIITETLRTKRVAGSVEAGRVTYVTRTLVWGFPDFTTVAIQPGGDALVVYGRLRFGKSDLGVNRARITGWLDQLKEALT